MIQDIQDYFLQGELNQNNLAKLAKVSINDLEQLENVKFQIDLTLNSLQELGYLCPNLKSLKLNGSIIKCLRDIGTSLQGLQILNISRCQLSDLSGINGFSKLTELYASFNFIHDLDPLGYHQNLTILDLEGNDIVHFDQLQNINMIKQLNLINNPIAKEDNYRQIIIQKLKKLQFLDDTNVKENLNNIKQQNKFFDIHKFKSKNLHQDLIFIENIFQSELNDEDLITQSIRQSQNFQKQNNQIENTFFQNLNKKSRYLDQQFQDENINQNLNSDQIDNSTKALIQKQKQELLQLKPFDYLQLISENKTKKDQFSDNDCESLELNENISEKNEKEIEQVNYDQDVLKDNHKQLKSLRIITARKQKLLQESKGKNKEFKQLDNFIKNDRILFKKLNFEKIQFKNYYSIQNKFTEISRNQTPTSFTKKIDFFKQNQSKEQTPRKLIIKQLKENCQINTLKENCQINTLKEKRKIPKLNLINKLQIDLK